MLGEEPIRTGPPDTKDFKKTVVRSYDGETIEDYVGNAVDTVWPAPDYRQYQREVVVQILMKLYVEDYDVVLLSSPTGSGKSLLINTVSRVVESIMNGESFVSTPLNTLIDQIEGDELIDNVVTLKGKNNYQCVHPEDRGKPVSEAICQRNSDFDCSFVEKHHENGGCPYYGRRWVVHGAGTVVTNLSYLMANSMIPPEIDSRLPPRNLLQVDETQSIESFALQFVGFEISQNSVPINWDRVSRMPDESASMDDIIDWIQSDIMSIVTAKIEAIESASVVSQKEQEQKDELRRFEQRVSNFIGDVKDNEWAVTHTEDFDGEPKIEFEPIYVGRFLGSYLWSQSDKFVLASATLPKGSWESEIGIKSKNVARIEVPSTFPPERRPIVTDRAVGKMTYKERDRTIPRMGDEISDIADEWFGESESEQYRGIVHCNSYGIADRLYNALSPSVRDRTRVQDQEERDEAIDNWLDADVAETGYTDNRGGQLLLSVAQEEGISLDHDQARFNIIAKASFPHMQDERVSYRMDSDTDGGADWEYYNSKCLQKIQQAAGRAMRAKDDWSKIYLLDQSAVTCVKRNKHLCEQWFLDAVDIDPSDEIDWPDE